MNRNLKCMIVDDEPMSLKLLKSYIGDIPYLTLTDCFEDAAEARNYLENNDVDILYTDVQMPGMTGLELVRSLPDPPGIILLSGYRDFAPEAFEVEAVDYLVKPFSFARFEKATAKARNLIIRNTSDAGKGTVPLNFIFIKNGPDYVKVLFEQIICFEASGDFVKIDLVSGKTIMWRIRMKELEGRLPGNIFLRVHKSYIINLHNVSGLLPQSVLLSNKVEIPVADAYKNDFKRRMGIK